MLLRRNVNRGVKSNEIILPSPILGLNVRDAISSMQPQYAITMDNYMPTETAVIIRSGYTKYVKLGEVKTGIKTLAYYSRPNQEKFIALYDGKAYDVTTTNFTEFNVEFTNTYCQTVQYKDRLYFVNGTDKPKVFYVDEDNNKHFEDWGFTGATNDKLFINCAVSKEFLWFVERNTLKAWYSAEAGNVAGQLKSFDLSQISKKGGYLIAVENWTVDGGQGIDDYTVFITSQGEVLIYSGSNPNSADDWQLRGSYNISKPIGYRCTMRYQGDIVIITEDGYIPMSKMLSLNNSGQSSDIFSDTIRGLVIKRTSQNKEKKGWESVVYSKKGYAIFNVPVANQFEQHVINVNTGAWCRFTNIRSYCWCNYGDSIYFGSDDTIYKFDDGYSDNGSEIEGKIEQAYNNFGTPAIKKISLINPRTKCSTAYNLTIYTNVDFQKVNVNYATNIGEIGGSLWNSSSWSNIKEHIDRGYKWQTIDATKVNSQWVAHSAVGTSISVVFKTKTRGNKIEWYDTEIRYETGTGII